MPETITPRVTPGGDNRDQFGTEWTMTLVDQEGKVIAGYSEHGTFHAYVEAEEFFNYAYHLIAYLQNKLGEAESVLHDLRGD
jgi:hypothetical protein